MQITSEDIQYLVKKYTEVRFADRGLFFRKSEDEAIDPTELPDVVDYFDVGHVQGFFIRNKGWDKTYLFLIGSNEMIDWFHNFWFRFMRTPYKEKGTNRKIKVHSGFFNSYLLIRDLVHEKVREDENILVYGQSLGGALATFAALDIQYNFPEKEVACLTTGAPRVGNRYFQESYDRRVPTTIRIKYGADIVTQLPPLLFGFRHVGTQVHLNPKKGWSVGDHMMPNYIAAVAERYQVSEISGA